MTWRHPRALGNTLYSIASSGISGLVNVLVQLMVAAVVPAEAFGRFAIAAATILLVVGAARLAIGQTDMLRGLPSRDDGPVNATYAVAVASLLTGAAVCAMSRDAPTNTLFIVGLALAAASVFVVQDCARHRAFRQSRAGVALLSDVVALVAVVAGLALLRDSPEPALLALGIWTAATALGTLPAIAALQYVPRLTRTRWLSRHRDLTVPGVADYLLQSGLPYTVNWIIVLAGSLEDLAGYRLVQLLFAGVVNVAVGLQAALLPRIVDAKESTPIRRVLNVQALAVFALAAGVCAVVVLLPADVGTSVFGSTWSLALPFLAPAALHGLANALSVMNAAVLRMAGRAVYLLVVRVGTVIASAVGVGVGVAASGAIGAAWAMAIVALATYLVRYVAERRALNDGIVVNSTQRSAP